MAVINVTYFDNLIKQIDDVTTCAELQSVTTSVLTQMQNQLSVIEEQLAKVQPILALLTPPVSPDDIIDWITGLIENVIQPLAAPAAGYQAQIVAIGVKTTEITNKIQEKASQFISCEIVQP